MKTKVIKRINIISAAKIIGLLFGGLYLIVGLVINVLALLVTVPALVKLDILGFGSGILATLLVAILVGAVSFIFGALYAWLYNVSASMVGGLKWQEIEVDNAMFVKKSAVKAVNEPDKSTISQVGEEEIEPTA